MKYDSRDVWVAQLVKYLPLAQVMFPGSWDRALNQAPCSARSLLLPLPLPLMLACSLSLISKIFKKRKKKKDDSSLETPGRFRAKTWLGVGLGGSMHVKICMLGVSWWCIHILCVYLCLILFPNPEVETACPACPFLDVCM